MDSATTSLVILGATVVLFIWNRLPVASVALLTTLALYFTGVLTLDEVLAGFGDPVIVFLASLFVVSEGLDASGIPAWIGQRLTERAGSWRRLVVTMCAACALTAGLITTNGAVAALLPMAVALAVRSGRAPSRVLLPLAFSGGSGALLALSGSPVNLIVSEAAQQSSGRGFGFFEFAAIGVPLVIGTVALTVWLGPKLVPEHAAAAGPDLSGYAELIADRYDRYDGFYRLRVRSRSPLVGTPVADLPSLGAGLRLVAYESGDVVEAGGVLVVAGPSGEVSRLVVDQVLSVAMRPVTGDRGNLVTVEAGVAEVVIPPRSPLLGEVVYPGMRRGPELVLLAVRRLGLDRGAQPTTLAEGDTVLVHGDWSAIEKLADDRDVLVVDAPDLVRRQVAPLGPKAVRAVVVLAAMVALLATSLVPPAIAGIAAALAMVLGDVVTGRQAIRAISWPTIILIGALIPLSVAIKDSGAADRLARVLVGLVGAGQPYLLMIALFTLTVGLGQVVSNTATTLIVTPIAVLAATDTGVSVRPVLMLIAVAGATSFLTPIATSTNMMVMGPGGYRFGDYWRLGAPLTALWLALALIVIPLVWRF